MESARFLITELEIWEKIGNDDKYEAVVERVQKNFVRLRELIARLADEQPDGDRDTTGRDE